MRLSQVLHEVTVRSEGDDCETVVWPDGLVKDERPLVLVSQDECAFHANDDCPWEWCEPGKMSLKQKSRGSLLMVSEFLSELAGRLRCSKDEVTKYAAEHPHSILAGKLAEGQAEEGVEARLILAPGAGAGKDSYFDNAQLITQVAAHRSRRSPPLPAARCPPPRPPSTTLTAAALTAQTKLAMEVFDAMDRHEVPARDVVSVSVGVSVGEDGRVTLAAAPVVTHLPPVRCQALFLFDHSSGHDAGASDGRSVTCLTKGPDWNAKLPPMRDGYYGQYPRTQHKMQYAEGDRLALDITIPAGIDADAASGPAADAPPQVVPEQLFGYTVSKCLGGLQYAAPSYDRSALSL